jgi:hypothetical protein
LLQSIELSPQSQPVLHCLDSQGRMLVMPSGAEFPVAPLASRIIPTVDLSFLVSFPRLITRALRVVQATALPAANTDRVAPGDEISDVSLQSLLESLDVPPLLPQLSDDTGARPSSPGTLVVKAIIKEGLVVVFWLVGGFFLVGCS